MYDSFLCRLSREEGKDRLVIYVRPLIMSREYPINLCVPFVYPLYTLCIPLVYPLYNHPVQTHQSFYPQKV